MGKTARFYKDGRAFFGKDTGEKFEGEVPVLENAITLTVTKEADHEKVAHSLAIVIQDIYLEHGQRVKVTIEKVPELREASVT